jgi:uncharacterized phiE125 gp8 family phage protein
VAWQPSYVSVPEFKAFIGLTDTIDDVVMVSAITAASRIVDRHTSRQFGLVAAPEARKYTARRDHCRRRTVIEIDDLQTVTGLTISTDLGTVDQFDLQPINAAAEGNPWTRVVVKPESAVVPTVEENKVTVTARWGWTTVPETIKQATLLQASRLFVRRHSPFGVAGSSELGSELRLLSRVDPDVAVALGPYVRWWSVA